MLPKNTIVYTFLFLLLLFSHSLQGCSFSDKCLSGGKCTKEQTCNSGSDPLKTCFQNEPSKKCDPACKKDETCVDQVCQPTCTPSCNDKEACKEGKCVPKLTPNCGKNHCTSDQVCNLGECRKKQKGCDPACAANEECKEGKCTRKGLPCSPPCPTGRPCSSQCQDKPCKSDADCQKGQECDKATGACKASSKGGTLGVGAKCTTISQCKPGLICLNVNTTDNFGYCFLPCKETKDCPAVKKCINISTSTFCVTEVQEGQKCGLAGSTQAVCRKGLKCDPGTGKCQQLPTTSLYEKCSLQVGCKDSNQTCVPLETGAQHGYCLEKCDPTAPKCPGDTMCLTLAKGGGACLYEGRAKEGDTCKPIDPKGDKLNVHEKCKSEFDCVKGKCTKPTTVKTGARCISSEGKRCVKNVDECIRFSAPDEHGYCLKKCDPKAPKCSTNERCVPLKANSGYCLPYGNAGNDDDCRPQTGGTLDPKQLCQKNLTCVQFGHEHMCIQLWKGNCKTPGKTCETGRLCLELSSGSDAFGGCFSTCQNNKCAKARLECRTNNKNTCWPKKSSDPSWLPGSICNTRPGASQCRQGWKCVQVGQGATKGFCTKSCSASIECPSVKNKAGKVIRSICHQQSKLCIFPCDQVGQICPDQLKCTQHKICGP